MSELPPTPEKMQTRIKERGDSLLLRRRMGGGCVAVVLGFWLAIWTAGASVLVQQVIIQPSVDSILFALPFVAAWCAGAAVMAIILFGRETLMVSRSGVTRRFSIIVPIRATRQPIDTIRRLGRVDPSRGSRSGGGHRIEIETSGQTIRYGNGLDDDEAAYLLALLKTQLRLAGATDVDVRPLIAAKPAACDGARECDEADTPALEAGHRVIDAAGSSDDAAAQEQDDESAGVDTEGDDHADSVAVAGAFRPPADRPGDSIIRIDRTERGLRLRSRRRFREVFVVVLAMTLFAGLWNGIVGLFAVELLSDWDGFLFILLIPFELVGLALLAGWVAVVLSALARHRWLIEQGGIRARTAFLGIGPSRSIGADEIGRIEVRRTRRRAPRQTGEPNTAEPRFQAVVVDRGGRDRITLDHLTEDEAKWAVSMVWDAVR